MRPHRRQPTRLPRPWDSPGKNTGVGCHFLPQCMKAKSESEVTQSCPILTWLAISKVKVKSLSRIRLFATLWTVAYQASPSMGFSRRVLEWGAIAFSAQVVLVIKNPAANPGDIREESSIPGWGRSPGGRAWQPTPVFLPGESHGWRSLMGYTLWGCKELDMTERLSTPGESPGHPHPWLSSPVSPPSIPCSSSSSSQTG